jgi:hypothetical protein
MMVKVDLRHRRLVGTRNTPLNFNKLQGLVVLWQQRGHKLMYIQTLRFVVYNYLFGRAMMSATEAPNFWDDEWVRIPPPNR